MRYQPLAELRVQHAYYRSGRCTDLEVTPSPAGARVVARHRLIVKPRPDGLLVLAPVDDEGAPFIPFAPGTALELELRVRNGDLVHFTDLGALTAAGSPRYTSAGVGGELTLGAREGQRRPPPGLFAEAELQGLDAAWLVDGPARFTISLAARRARWLYYVVTDLKDVDIELVDGDAVPLVFQPSPELPADPRAAELVAMYPGARLLRFVSAGLVACAEEPRRRLELRLGGQRLALRLPNPALTSHAALEFTVDTVPQRQESLFRVVKHLTQAFAPNG
jgi:hypothetical protein